MIGQTIELEKHKLVHEVRNMLSVCNGYLEMIPKANETNTNKYLKIISHELEKIIGVINQNKENIIINKKEFYLNTLLEELRVTLSDLLRNNNVKLLVSKTNILLTADYNKLMQVFTNIIKNSLEAKNKEHLLITIKTNSYKKYCRIYISDNGKGMTKNELANIFTPYYTTKKNGTGLGTINIKEIVELHDGTIEFLSSPNKGTTVIIKLPIS